MRTSYNKKSYVFLSIIFVIGILCGLLFLNIIDNETSSNIIQKITYYIESNSLSTSFLLKHIIVLAIIIVFSFFVISIIFSIIYLFYNGLTIGLLISLLYSISGLKGLLYSIIYILIVKTIFIILLLFFISMSMKIGICIFKYFFYKDNDKINKLIRYFKKTLVIYILIIINDIFVYYVGSNILKIFQVLIS